MRLSEQEIESERLKTTIIALNAKAVIVDDHKIDVDNHYSNHSNSEVKRGDLHEHITAVAEKVHVDNANHTQY